MHVITRRTLLQFATIHPDARQPLDDWYRTAKRSAWKSILDVRQNHPRADAVGPFTAFNIAGNKYRLITSIQYRTGRVYIKQALTHPDMTGEGGKIGGPRQS